MTDLSNGRSRTLLELAQDHFRAELDRREASGDETVAVYRYRLPWCLDRLGPPMVDASVLRRLEQTVLHGGRRRSFFANDEPVPWIDDPRELIGRFLDSLEDTGGRPWRALVAQLETIWRDVRAFSASVDPEPPRDVLSMAFPMHPDEAWKRADPQLAQLLNVAESKAAVAVDAAWNEAFRSGRVLVFREGRHGWEFFGPDRWPAAPFACLSLAELKADQECRDHEAAMSAKAAREAWRRRGQGGDVDLLGLPSASTRRPIEAFAVLEARDKRLSDRRDLAFLLSSEMFDRLDPEARVPEEAPKPAPRRRGRPSYDEKDAPLVEEICRRIRTGEFSKILAAVEAIYGEKPKAFEGRNSSPESVQRRLCRKVGFALDRSGE